MISHGNSVSIGRGHQPLVLARENDHPKHRVFDSGVSVSCRTDQLATTMAKPTGLTQCGYYQPASRLEWSIMFLAVQLLRPSANQRLACLATGPNRARTLKCSSKASPVGGTDKQENGGDDGLSPAPPIACQAL